MWRCDQCDATGEDHFEVCWQCGAPRAGIDPDPAASQPETEFPLPKAPPSPTASETFRDVKRCPSCDVVMDERGEIPLRTGGGREEIWRVEAWACPRCRRLEFYEKPEDE